MGWETPNMDHLIRSEIWSQELKDVLLDDLMRWTVGAKKYDAPDIFLMDEVQDG